MHRVLVYELPISIATSWKFLSLKLSSKSFAGLQANISGYFWAQRLSHLLAAKEWLQIVRVQIKLDRLFPYRVKERLTVPKEQVTCWWVRWDVWSWEKWQAYPTWVVFFQQSSLSDSY
jgi:hypothetical protein